MFTTQDTLRGEAADSSLWNSYAYCNGDPVNNYDPSGHMKKKVVFAYHNKSRLNKSFLDQANHSYYYKTKKVTIYKIPTYRSLKKRWNKLKKKVKTVYIYLHGYTKYVCFPEGNYHLQSSKGFKKKRSIKRVYLFSCYGGAGGSSSVAHFFKTKVNKEAKIFASKESVSYTKVKAWRGMSYKYAPRYSFKYALNNGMWYYDINPVKEIKEW